MQRKKFIGLLGVSALSSAFRHENLSKNHYPNQIIPPYLKKGDTIAITSPAGSIGLDEIQPAIAEMEMWGLKIKIGNTIGKKDFIYGGTDQQRIDDFNMLLADKSVKAIMCARGGYGLIRILDKINFNILIKQPKWIIGFSDITNIHCHLQNLVGVASIHSKMCNSFPKEKATAEPIQIETIQSIKNMLFGVKTKLSAAHNPDNRPGTAKGILVGGNLKTIESLAGSNAYINTDNKILFLEDTGEKLYSIDRMFWNLQRSGRLKNLAGLIIGGFKLGDKPEDEPFGKTVAEIVMEKVKNFKYPVCFDFPVGHQKNNFALKVGAMHQLIVNNSITNFGDVSLKEI